jgi:uncharacterized spore protein YtfJ
MEKKETTIDSPVVVGEVTLVPIARLSLNYERSNGGIFFFGMKQPLAVVVISVSGKRAFRITGEEVSVQELIQELPGMKEMLEGM